MPVALPEQGRSGTVGEPPINLDWTAKDPDVDLPVYIIVSAPRDNGPHDPRGLHWRLVWQVARDRWRNVHIVEHRDDRQRAPNPRYVYWGALTQSSDPSASKSTKVLVGMMSLAMRQSIERLALEVPVMWPDGTWNCQNWILDLLTRMYRSGIISQRRWEEVVGAAHNGQ
ncbi:hypothetical protein GY45DRAFT_1315217 [Cubamyces sp. BRFM 1775]|nr:hypothetical protein GY45DRAFT_1315217 [Cubamyces sp. BRFM 1775]